MVWRILDKTEFYSVIDNGYTEFLPETLTVVVLL